MALVGELPPLPPGPINTLENSWLEWDSGKNILGMKTAWFVGIPEGEFIRDIQRGGASKIPEHLRSAHEAGQFFLTLEIAAKLQLPNLKDLAAQTEARIPQALLIDPGATWTERPMRIKPASQRR